MKVWHDKSALVERLAQARRDAYNTAPRGSNDQLEAGYFLAMMAALFPGAVESAIEPQEEAPKPSAQSEPLELPPPVVVREEDDPATLTMDTGTASDLDPKASPVALQPTEIPVEEPPQIDPPTIDQVPENEYDDRASG